jgi:uncharacterized protein
MAHNEKIGSPTRVLSTCRCCVATPAQPEGDWPLAAMQRLATSLHGVPDTAATWAAQGSRGRWPAASPSIWLHLQGRPWCRCNASVACRRMRRTWWWTGASGLWPTKTQAERLDEELEDDVLVMPARLDLAELLEDELILALPLVPRHAGSCPAAAAAAGHRRSRRGAGQPLCRLG